MGLGDEGDVTGLIHDILHHHHKIKHINYKLCHLICFLAPNGIECCNYQTYSLHNLYTCTHIKNDGFLCDVTINEFRYNDVIHLFTSNVI